MTSVRRPEKRPHVLVSFTGTRTCGLFGSGRRELNTELLTVLSEHVHERTGEFTVAVNELWTHQADV